MNKALRYELEMSIPELAGQIYPTNAPESCKRPHLVYYVDSTRRVKTLDGYTDKTERRYLLNVLATREEEMYTITQKVESLLLGLPGREIGKAQDVYVEDVTLHNTAETFENALKLYRGILDVTIYT